MAVEIEKYTYPQQKSIQYHKLLKYLDLERIINNSYDSIFVTDKYGYVILANASTERFLGISPDKLIGQNVRSLVESGVYSWSPTLKAIQTRSVVSGLIKNKDGQNLMCTSTALFDSKGEIMMIITNARNKDLIDKYLEELEKEKLQTERYKNAVKYLNEIDSEQNMVVAESQQMREIVSITRNIAKTDSTVLLAGESGTGKEVIARHIHRNSYRSKEPFIPVNCAAIPSELLESEFFGYVKGAFTGASSQGKPGLFEIADNGTLFLDEVGELPLAMQSKLLRVLETGEVQRLGSTRMLQTNVRLIAATNRDLESMVNEKTFRCDLYYRLNVIPVNLPPLKNRPEDILVLANKFLEELNHKYSMNKQFSNQAIQGFLSYNWPGNVRELGNLIERLVITSPTDKIYFNIDPLECNKTDFKNETSTVDYMFKGTLKSVLKSVEESYIKRVLDECGGKVGEAACRLGIHRTMLYRKINNTAD